MQFPLMFFVHGKIVISYGRTGKLITHTQEWAVLISTPADDFAYLDLPMEICKN